MKPSSLREQAILLRRNGFSYGMISNALVISKSTLSGWLKEIPFTPNKEVQQRVGLARARSGQFKSKQRMSNIQAMHTLAAQELGIIALRDLWFLGLGLYLGEGTKRNETTRLVNSDPHVIKIMMAWFRKICHLTNENIVPSVHLYPDVDEQEAIRYWSRVTRIALNQFGKTQVDARTNKSSKRRGKLPYGTLHLQARSRGNKALGRSLHRKIIGWIEAAMAQIK